jgi:hypothetical protein
LDSYSHRKQGIDEVAAQLIGEMTVFEKELLKRQEVVEIRGKVCMKWLRYQRVISLKIQVGNTNQRNKWYV